MYSNQRENDIMGVKSEVVLAMLLFSVVQRAGGSHHHHMNIFDI